MSNTALAWIGGIVAWLVLCWLVTRLLGITRTTEDQELEDMEQLAAVSRPAPLERQHVKAGTAWGKQP